MSDSEVISNNAAKLKMAEWLWQEYQHRHTHCWTGLFQLTAAVAFLAGVPYLSRETAGTLGIWALLPALLAVAVAIFGLLVMTRELAAFATVKSKYRELQSHLTNITHPPKSLFTYYITIYLVGLILASGINCVAILRVWLPPAKATTSSTGPKQVDLKEFRSNVLAFLSTLDPAVDRPSKPQVRGDYLAPQIRQLLQGAPCVAKPGTPGHPIEELVCSGNISVHDQSLSCEFTWILKPAREGSSQDLVVVRDRMDLVRFQKSGYGVYAVSKTGSGPVPHIGVAKVACGAVAQLDISFVLSSPEDIGEYKSIWRTVGFDWKVPEHYDTPYLPELFALSSLYHLSVLLRNSRDLVPTSRATTEGHVLLSEDAVRKLRALMPNELRVGNRSDYQLGHARGACKLALQSMISSSQTKVTTHIAPSLFIPSLVNADPSLVALPSDAEVTSIPCAPLMATLANIGFPDQLDGYPQTLRSEIVNYELLPGEVHSAARRRVLGTRAAGLTLYLLGFALDAPKVSSNDVYPDVVVGRWPRAELL